jgi:hypothetical protein
MFPTGDPDALPSSWQLEARRGGDPRGLVAAGESELFVAKRLGREPGIPLRKHWSPPRFVPWRPFLCGFAQGDTWLSPPSGGWEREEGDCGEVGCGGEDY